MDAKLNLSFEKSDGYLIVVETGKVTPESLRISFREIADAAKQQGFSRILVDSRNLSGSMNDSHRFFAGEEIAKVWRGLKVAILVREGRINKFMENTAVNRGANIIVVSDFDKAARWLTDNPGK